MRECLDSCLNQDIERSEYEIICVNDGSTTDVLRVLEEYEKNNYIKIFSQENMGSSGARNTGIRVASGDYIWFLDPDDFIQINCLLMIKGYLEKHPCDRLHLGAYHFCNELSNEEKKLIKAGELKPNHVIKTVSAAKCIYKKEVIVENELRFRLGVWVGQDLLFNFELDQIPHKESQLDSVIYFYRIHGLSATHHTDGKKRAKRFAESHLKGCRIVKCYYDNDSVKKKRTIRYLHSDLSQIMINLAKLPYSETVVFLKEILDNGLFPFVELRSVGVIWWLYTNIHSFNMRTVCKAACHKRGFYLLKMWTKLWSSKAKISFEKRLKRLIGSEV